MRIVNTYSWIAAIALLLSGTQLQAADVSYSADALYNLANSYARAGKPGLAVLNYERAMLLAPRDADIRANLNQVRASAHVSAQPRSRLMYIAQAASPAFFAWLSVGGLALIGVGVLAIRMRRLVVAGIAGIAFGIAAVGLTACDATVLSPRMHDAVVLVDQTPGHVSPVPMGDTAFVLPEAETVRILAGHEDFILVRTGTGLTGWVSRASLAAVVPEAGP